MFGVYVMHVLLEASDVLDELMGLISIERLSIHQERRD